MPGDQVTTFENHIDNKLKIEKRKGFRLLSNLEPTPYNPLYVPGVDEYPISQI